MLWQVVPTSMRLQGRAWPRSLCPLSQEGREAMNIAAAGGKSMPCLPSQLLPVLFPSHVNVKKCNPARLSPKEGKKKALTCGQRQQSGNTFWDLVRQDLKKELLMYLTWVVNQKSALQEYFVVIRNCWWNQVVVWCRYDSFQRLCADSPDPWMQQKFDSEEQCFFSQFQVLY